MNRPARRRHGWMVLAMAIAGAAAFWLAWSNHKPRPVMDELPAELGVKP